MGGNFGVKIKVFLFLFSCSSGAAKYAQANFKEVFFGKIFFVKLLRPFVSINSIFKIFDVSGTLKLSKILNSLRACSALNAHAEHMGQELMRIRNW
jgi:hypothetical protein